MPLNMANCIEKLRYYLLVDDSFQWDAAIASIRDNGEIVYYGAIDVRIDAKIISRILERHPYKYNWRLTTPFSGEQSYQAWSISQYEYDKIYQIIHLWPRYQEYLSLIRE